MIVQRTGLIASLIKFGTIAARLKIAVKLEYYFIKLQLKILAFIILIVIRQLLL